MKKNKIKEIVFSEQCNPGVDLSLDNYSAFFHRDYYIDIIKEDSHYSENNSYDAYKLIEIYKFREETDEECANRIAQLKKMKADLKKKRYKTYLELKKEFECIPIDFSFDSVDPALKQYNILEYLKKLLIIKHIGDPFIYIENLDRFSNNDHTIELKCENNSIFLNVYNKFGRIIKYNCNNITLEEIGSILYYDNVIELNSTNDIFLEKN